MDYVKKKELAGEINRSEKCWRSFIERLRNKECVLLARKKKNQTQTYSNQNRSRNLKALKCKEMETESCAGADAGAETLCPEGSCRRRCACRGRLLCQGRAVLLRTPQGKRGHAAQAIWTQFLVRIWSHLFSAPPTWNCLCAMLCRRRKGERRTPPLVNLQSKPQKPANSPNPTPAYLYISATQKLV